MSKDKPQPPQPKQDSPIDVNRSMEPQQLPTVDSEPPPEPPPETPSDTEAGSD